jgi:hypothetical protein
MSLNVFSDDIPEKEIEIKLEISKKAGLLRKPVRFSDVPGRIHEAIERNEDLWWQRREPCSPSSQTSRRKKLERLSLECFNIFKHHMVVLRLLG